jgi:hypothetical protein
MEVMSRELELRRKWTLRAGDRRVVVVKKAYERSTHVVMKALLWALYLPEYPDLVIEVAIGDRYKPDVVALDQQGRPCFWGEAGQVGVKKIRSLARRYRRTHLAIAKWDTDLDLVHDMVRGALTGLDRKAPTDVICFPPDSIERFMDAEGTIRIHHDDVDWFRFCEA